MQSRPHFNAHLGGVDARVGEGVNRSGRDDCGVARPGDDRPASQAETHAPLHDGEPLLLLWVGVAAGYASARCEVEVKGEQSAPGVGGGLAEDDPLTAEGVLDDLSDVCHGHDAAPR